LAGQFGPLGNLKEEADAIARIAGSQNVTELRGVAANRERVLDGSLSTYKYINFSVHGDPNRRSPDLSALLLSAYDERGRQRDPYLFARDLKRIKLSAELVTLASCGSGLGRELRGEGLVGLTQAFFRAGASRVLVSTWDLNDFATSRLLPSFYDNLLNKGQSPASALRNAQIDMWKKGRWSAPSYWAGLVLQGEWK
jgi:CHAT domain-containing protein